VGKTISFCFTFHFRAALDQGDGFAEAAATDEVTTAAAKGKRRRRQHTEGSRFFLFLRYMKT
jgi:hypothetical protein